MPDNRPKKTKTTKSAAANNALPESFPSYPGFIPPHGGYEKLLAYRKSEIIYDATVRFCDRFIDRKSRTHDQMVQAARSGNKNIAEGSQVSGTSKEGEIKLTRSWQQSPIWLNWCMSKPSTGRRAHQPFVPQVSVETWQALVAAAAEFNRLAPWQWMHDSHVIGLRHPVTKEVLLGSILGRLCQVFALLVYRNDAGRRWILNTILNDGDPSGFEDEDSALEQDAVKVEFVLKRELVKEDQAVLSAAGFTPAAKRGRVWPRFHSIVPGAYPWHVTQAEAETLLFALPRVAAVAKLLRAQPRLWDDHCDGQIGFVPDEFDPETTELCPELMRWEPMLPPPAPAPVEVSLSEEVLAQLNRLPQAKGFHLEIDVSYAPFPISSADRPRFPKLALAVDRASGAVLGFSIGELPDHEGARALAVALREGLKQVGHRPEKIGVQKPRVGAMLEKAAGALNVPLVQVMELPSLNDARENMQQHLNRFR